MLAMLFSLAFPASVSAGQDETVQVFILRLFEHPVGSLKRFPFQENADSQFNTALLYELPLLRYYGEPLLRRITPASPAYAEAVRLLKFLEYITPLQPSEIEAIPPTSILREFIGGQTL